MMLRKLISMALAAVLAVTLAACGRTQQEEPADSAMTDTQTDNTQDNTESPAQNVPQTTEPSEALDEAESSETDGAEGKMLIAYFSWSNSGNTEKMATYIQEQTGGELLELEPRNPYPTDYEACGEVALVERDENARPEIANLPDSISEYDTIFLGYPIWWHTAPMIIGTFLQSYDLTGVEVYPFAQSSSMDTEQFDNSMAFVRENAPGANVHDGLFAPASDTEAMQAYLTENGFAGETAEAEAETEMPEPELWVWPTDTPENQGFDAQALSGIHATYDSFPLLSAMIVKNGYVIDTYYKDGYDEQSVFVLNSASKSVTSALTGIAIDLGYITSVDDLLRDYLPQVAQQADARWQSITLRHLLTHTSGITSTDDWLWYDWRGAENWMQYILDLPMTADPGTAFSYSTGNTHLLAAAVEAATGMTLYDFGQQYLFGPMQMDSVRIDTDPQGIADGGNGIWMTTADMAKIGLLYLNHGSWEDQQMISESWVEQSTTTQFVPGGGRANYGFQWWVRTFGTQSRAAYFAQGHAGQYIMVVPELALVIAFNSDYEGATSVYWELANAIVDACQAGEAL